MGRTVPPRTPEQQAAADRIAALIVGTPAALRAYATRYQLPLIQAEDLDTNRARIVSAREAKA
jgi:hypothetical protein